MPPALLVQGRSTGFSTASTTFFLGLGGCAWISGATEDAVEQTIRAAGAFSKLGVLVTANTAANNSTFKSRKNGADGNLTMTIGAGATGWFEDTTHSDAVTAGDTYNLALTKGTGGATTVTLGQAVVLFAATSGTHTFHACASISASGLGLTTNSATRYITPTGQLRLATADDATTRLEVGAAGTMSNLQVYIVSNARTTDTTYTFRKNGSDGANTVTVGSTATGLFEDTTHTDAVAVGDDINVKVVTGIGGNSINVGRVSLSFSSGDSDFDLFAGDTDASGFLSNSVDNYMRLGGDRALSATEANVQITMPDDFKATRTRFSFGSADTTGATCKLRVNGADGNGVATVPPTTASVATDASGEDDLLAGDEVDFEVSPPNAGTRIAYWLGVTLDGDPPAPPSGGTGSTLFMIVGT